MPVRNEIPSDQPELFSKMVQTLEEDCLGLDMATHVSVMMTKNAKVQKTCLGQLVS